MSAAPDDRPDVLVVVTDDLGFGDLSCYGATAYSTPVLDALAGQGRLFSDAHAASSVCTPSRYALLTGRYPWRTPLRSRVLGGTDGALIDADTPTLAGVLGAIGYRTAAVGKWHLGLDWQLRDGSRRSIDPATPFRPAMEADGWDVDYAEPFDGGPLDRGFDEFFGISGSLDMPPYCFLRGREVETRPTVPKSPLITSQRPGPAAPGWEDSTVDLRFAEEAEAWLARTRPASAEDAPRLLYFATAAPHRPCVPPPGFDGRTGIGPRADAIVMIDEIVGRLLAELDRSSRPSLVVFTSDNGAPTDHPEDGRPEDHAPNGDLRGQKADVFDGGHRIPLIISGPGVPAGHDDRPVSLLDVLPSLLAHLAPAATDEQPEAARPPGQGDPLPALLVGPPGSGGAVDGDDRLFRGDAPPRVLGATAFDGSLVLMRGSETAIYSTGSGGFSAPVGEPTPLGGDRGQFYDRAADPAQTTDLWRERTDRRQQMTAQFVRTTGYGDTDDQLR